MSSSLLGSRLLLGGTALDALGDGAVDVVGGDPASVKVLGTGAGASRFVAGQGVGAGSLDDGSRLAGLAATGGALGLREERLDPGLVDKVQGGAERTGQEDIQEDAASSVSRRTEGERGVCVRNGRRVSLTSEGRGC